MTKLKIIDSKKSFKGVQEEKTRAKGTAEDLLLFGSDMKLVKTFLSQKMYKSAQSTQRASCCATLMWLHELYWLRFRATVVELWHF